MSAPEKTLRELLAEIGVGGLLALLGHIVEEMSANSGCPEIYTEIAREMDALSDTFSCVDTP